MGYDVMDLIQLPNFEKPALCGPTPVRPRLSNSPRIATGGGVVGGMSVLNFQVLTIIRA
jgi:hypothetical protein